MSTRTRAAFAGAFTSLAFGLAALASPGLAQEAHDPGADHDHSHHDHHDHSHHDPSAHEPPAHEGPDHSGHDAATHESHHPAAGHGKHRPGARHEGHGGHGEHGAAPTHDGHAMAGGHHRHGPIPDGAGPAGVMLDHMHHAGSFMVGYRYMYGIQDGRMRHGTKGASDHDVMHNACGTHGHGCTMKPTEMRMHMHMLDIMYAPTDWLTLMVMPHWMTMDMTMAPLGGGHGGHGGSHSHGTDGLGDTILAALFKVSEGPGFSLHMGLGLSAPTGSVDKRKANGDFTHYDMQLGSGTWDLLPSLTYRGHAGRWSWGAQASGVLRLEDENESGFAFGNIFEATAWGSYRLTDWLSASVRLVHMQQGEIEGHYNGPHGHASPPDLQPNYGGRFWDVGFGVNVVVPSGPLAGHHLSVEWLEPVRDDVNGYQQARTGTLFAKWSKGF